jgi:hypothetical protein
VPRWQRSRFVGLAIGATVLLLALSAGSVGSGAGTTLRVSLPDGQVLLRVALPADAAFALRYRNSLYGSLAQERFVVMDDGALRLTELRAEELAVLEEYYAIATPARAVGGRLGLVADPAHVPEITALQVAATDRGARTLIVAGHDPIELWRFVDDRTPQVILEAEP